MCAEYRSLELRRVDTWSIVGAQSVMDPTRIYFTWPDRRFTYECATCGACCRGLGIGIDAAGGQKRRLLTLYPQLTPFMRKRGATWTAFNPRGECWFLTGDGLCRIEAEHGRADKPASCRLFPFNRVFRLGDYTIIDYNSVVCPLQVTAEEPTGIPHESVLADIGATVDSAIVGTPLPAERPAEEGRRLVTRERALAEACFAAADELSANDIESGLERGWRAQVRDRNTAGTFADARERISRALITLTDAPWQCPGPEDARTALWLTPSMRFNELYGPRQYATRTELVGALPDIWLAWLHFLALGGQLAERPLGLRAATTVWSEQMPLCYLAARWRRAPTLEPGEYQWPGADDDPDATVRRFAQACIDNRARRQPLDAVLGPLLADKPAAERVALARMLAQFLPSVRWRKPRAS